MMRECRTCGAKFSTRLTLDGVLHHLPSRRRCYGCFPFGASRADTPEIRHQKALDKQRAWVKRRRAEDGIDPFKAKGLDRKRVIIGLVGGCQLCGYCKCLKAICFHHMHDKTRSLTLREFQHAPSLLRDELRKCVVLCHNCHSEVHAGTVDPVRLLELHKQFARFFEGS
jgi:hypothetical protein